MYERPIVIRRTAVFFQYPYRRIEKFYDIVSCLAQCGGGQSASGNNIIELFYSSVRILEENRRAANHNGSFIHISNCFIQPSLNGGYKSIRELPIDIYPNIKVTPQYHK
jgi:hypothetical protein